MPLFSADILIGVLILMLLWEHFFPREALKNYQQRWQNNFLLYLINILIKWAVFTFVALLPSYHLAFSASYSVYYYLPDYFSNTFILIFSILLLDLFWYAIHRLYHRYKVLWRAHSIHHSGLALDVTTNFRHHPFEQLITLCFYAVFVFIVQIPAFDVALYAVLAGIMQLWHHSNIVMPVAIEKVLRWFIITPSLHQLHHSAEKFETNSNYGTVFSCWDRIFFSLVLEKKSTNTFLCGLEYFREPQQQKIMDILKQVARRP